MDTGRFAFLDSGSSSDSDSSSFLLVDAFADFVSFLGGVSFSSDETTRFGRPAVFGVETTLFLPFEGGTLAAFYNYNKITFTNYKTLTHKGTLTSLPSSSSSSDSSSSSSSEDSCFRLRPLPRAGGAPLRTAPPPRLGATFFFFGATTSSSLKSSDSSSLSSSSLVSSRRRPRPRVVVRAGTTVRADLRRSPSESEPPPDGLY